LRRNCLLNHIIEGKVERKERKGRRHKQLLNDLKERNATAIWKRKHYIALCEELGLEEATDLSQDRIRGE
jgi:hypothetical protein